jgi:hypothetical protein
MMHANLVLTYLTHVRHGTTFLTTNNNNKNKTVITHNNNNDYGGKDGVGIMVAWWRWL